jgi:hypothetical protein
VSFVREVCFQIGTFGFELFLRAKKEKAFLGRHQSGSLSVFCVSPSLTLMRYWPLSLSLRDPQASNRVEKLDLLHFWSISPSSTKILSFTCSHNFRQMVREHQAPITRQVLALTKKLKKEEKKTLPSFKFNGFF